MTRWLACSLVLLSIAAAACSTRKPPGAADAGPSGNRDTGVVRTDGGITPPPFTCTPGNNGCYQGSYYTCGADGRSRDNEQACPSACSAQLGCVTCVPGSRRCEGTTSQVCNGAGTGWATARDCAAAPWNSACGATGFCNDACGEVEAAQSNVGCDYWATPLANTSELDSTIYDFRVVIANPNGDPVNVLITKGNAMVFSGTVPANGLRDIQLDWIAGQSTALMSGMWTSLNVRNAAYRIKSDKPIIVSQFNPFEYNTDGQPCAAGGNNCSYTNDASLLLPSHTLTGNYYGASYSPLSNAAMGLLGRNYGKFPGYIAIVGITPEPTPVEVQLTGRVAAGAGGIFPGSNRGDTIRFTIEQGQVVHIMSAVPPNCARGRPGFVAGGNMGGYNIPDTCNEAEYDITGSRIVAENPVEVFGGHACAYVPANSGACDHLEEVLPPVETWGREFVSAPMGDGSTGGVNIVRVVAAFADTAVTVDPPQGGVSTMTVGAGEYVEFRATSPFKVTGSKAVLVAQFLVGQLLDPTNPSMRGDPSLTVVVPAEQYRSDYSFILPTSYSTRTGGQNFIQVVRSPGATIMLDGTPVNGTWQAIGDREIANIPLMGGQHRITSGSEDQTFGVTTYGMGRFTSYAAIAGLNLRQITIPVLL